MGSHYAHQLYTKFNNDGRGFAIGQEGQTLLEALHTEGYELVANHGDGLLEATRNNATYLVGGDAMGRNAWAVRA